MILLRLLLLLDTSNPTLMVRCDDFDYTQEAVALKGNIEISHDEAKLEAESGTLLPRSGHGFEALQSASFEGKVRLALANRSTLTCWQSRFDLISKHASFLGRLPLERVVYRELGPKGLKLECDRMEVKLAASSMEKALKEPFRRISAIGQVKVKRGTKYAGSAEVLDYIRHPTEEQLGLLEVEEGRQLADLLILREQVELEQAGLGLLQCDGEVWIGRGSEGKEASVDQILCLGCSILKGMTEARRTLSCDGLIAINGREQTATLTSSAAGEEERQVRYEDDKGGFSADRVHVHYSANQGEQQLEKITLVGHVKVRNFASFDNDPFHIQYALAERVDYNPATEEMDLIGSKKQRVLFLDPALDTRVSAERIVFNRAERSAKGIGNVRFSLSDDEVKQMCEVFDFR